MATHLKAQRQMGFAPVSAALISFLGLAGCTVNVTPEAVLRPNPEFQRVGAADLRLDREDEIVEPVRLQHSRLESDIGRIAVTEARTGSKRLIVHCMGNKAARFSDGVDYLNGLVPFADALIFDYPGFGDSDGEPTLENFSIALRAIAAKVREEPDREIYLWGHSLGGFVCADLAKRTAPNIAGVIYETTASDIETLSAYWAPWYLKPFLNFKIDPRFLAYDGVAALDGFDGRVLVLSAAKDKELPTALNADLAAKLTAAGHDVTFIEFEDAGHYDIAEQPKYRAAVSNYYEAE